VVRNGPQEVIVVVDSNPGVLLGIALRGFCRSVRAAVINNRVVPTPLGLC
jgi:hypothetical protein